MSGRSADVLVVGGGIVGAACAEAFSREGLSVVVVEADTIGGGASAAGMGHVVVMDDSEAQFALTAYSRRLWEELRPELPARAECDPCGTIWIAADAEEFAAVRAKREFHLARGARAEILDERALAEAEPNLRRGLAGGLLIPDDRVVYAPCVATWLAERAAARGARVLVAARAIELRDDGARLSDGTSIAAGAVVNAAGAAAAELTPEISIRPRKGHLAITDRRPGFLRRQLVELSYLKSVGEAESDSTAFNVQPRSTGQVLIGSSRQFDARGAAVEPAMLARMLRRAIGYMPGLADLPAIRVWTGFRAATADHLPLIGPAVGRKNLYLATGHEGLGITTSLATGRLLADLLTGRESEIPREPYLPARFDADA